MASVSPLKEPAAGDDVRGLWRIVLAAVKVLNALINHTSVVQGNKDVGSLTITEGNALLELPKASGGGGSGGSGALGPVLFVGAANGQPCLFLINSDGVAYSSPPTKPDGSAYPVANPD